MIGQTEGTLFVEFELDRAPYQVERVFFISDGTFNEVVGVSLGSSGAIYTFVTDGGVDQAAMFTSGNAAGTYKVAIAYKANDFAFYMNGVQKGTDSSGSVPACNRVDVSNLNNTAHADSKIKQALLFDTRLSNSDLATLTTL